MDTIISLRDLGYKQAQSADTLENAARYAIDNIAGFPEAIMPEAKAEVVGGYRLRYAETACQDFHCDRRQLSARNRFEG